MKPKVKSTAIILSIAFYVVAGMIVRRGGFEAAWEDNSGGLIIAALAIVVLTIRTLTKRSPEKPLEELKDQ